MPASVPILDRLDRADPGLVLAASTCDRLALLGGRRDCRSLGCIPAPPPTPAPFSVVEASVAEMQEAMAEGRVTSREIVQEYLQRIAYYENSLNAATPFDRSSRRGWRKLHLGVDQSGVILVHTLTEATGEDATTALDLLTAVEGPLVRVTADAAYDTVAVYETAGARGATVVIPPAKTANVSGHGPRSPARDRTITLVKTLGRRRWKKASGYHRQGRVENAFFRYKSIIGDGLRARSPAGQGSEIILGCEILNRMTALGRPASYRIGR